MSSTDDEVDPHVLRKYSLLQKLGKGVSPTSLDSHLGQLVVVVSTFSVSAGLWRSLEGR